MIAEIDGARFKLTLTPEGLPYCLYREVAHRPGRTRWALVWAEWHKGLPTGIRARAIEAMGFRWDRTPPTCRWVPTFIC
jgi:hypothetical protein